MSTMMQRLALLGVCALGAVMAAEEDFPYKKPEEADGINMGRGQGLALPSFLLYLILFAFLGGAGFLVKKIFDLEKTKEQKEAEREAKRQAKLAKKRGKGN
eukprot:TRINITY_DN95318_c0_g1_i1.p1 TRINITY_DN95318_c0_g1~~TRINITY_DN95318_c0_g1_i1.p1  ORF type:complete len:115 (-),score=67.02 TRINITY_DN95318_c0_g1_i1:143-445(-)